MRIILNPGKNRNVIATLAIGKKYFNLWEKYAMPTWLRYCKKLDLGLIVFDKELISKSHIKWKKPTWQKGLIGSYLLKKNLNINNVCYLDSDILINFNSPNIFDFHENNKISLVSHRFRMPYNYMAVIKRVAFCRHNFYNKKYPLDSSLFMSLKNVYKLHGLKPQKDEACLGLFVFNVKKFSNFFEKSFFKYDKNVYSFTDNGDQTHYNYEIQNFKKVNWLNYKFQTLWLFEMAWKYPFLYAYKNKKNLITKKSIEASLSTCFFLHFAGSWFESDMWKIKNIFNDKKSVRYESLLNEYNKTLLTGLPKGKIEPK